MHLGHEESRNVCFVTCTDHNCSQWFNQEESNTVGPCTTGLYTWLRYFSQASSLWHKSFPNTSLDLLPKGSWAEHWPLESSYALFHQHMDGFLISISLSQGGSAPRIQLYSICSFCFIPANAVYIHSWSRFCDREDINVQRARFLIFSCPICLYASFPLRSFIYFLLLALINTDHFSPSDTKHFSCGQYCLFSRSSPCKREDRHKIKYRKHH